MQWNSAQWFDQIRKHKHKVFLVVDDISKRQQFDELIPDLKELPAGSRVLITSQESGVLKNIMLDIPHGELYHVSKLSFVDSLDLFVWCAFRKNNIDFVDASFHDFIKDISKACCGLPLALEVMGGFLSNKKNFPKDEKYWKEATLALRKNGDIITSLQISYDGLVEEDDKRMFLDISCFMLGQPKRVAIEVWNSNGFYGSSSSSLSRLINKCLVKLISDDDDGNEEISMHDLLRDMGHSVVLQRAPYKREMQTHIWDPGVATKVLQKKQGSDEVLALSVVGEKSGTACKADLYARMRELRYLLLDDCPVSGDFSNWSEELRWLQWRCFPHEELPSSLNLPNLAVLDLANSDFLTRFWAKDFELEVPYKELRMLILSNCTELRELSQHISKLSKLKYMNLEGCRSLSSLPDSLGDLTELDYLNLNACRSLTTLPDSLGDLTELDYLVLWGCKLLEYLPDSIVKLLKLRELVVSFSGLKRLPVEFGRLESLAVFRAVGTTLEELPESFGLLQGLKEVDLQYCRQLRNLSENFGSLGKLRNLNLADCESLTKLPDSFSNLSNLEELYMNGASNLKSCLFSANSRS